MEIFQRLRKIYGDLECQYCGELITPFLVLISISQLLLHSYWVCWLSSYFYWTGKLFWYKVHYNVHVRTHTKEHSHYCSKCSYSSITKSSLKRHQIQKHSNLLLPCSHADCTYTTTDKYKLQAHLRVHEQEQVSNPQHAENVPSRLCRMSLELCLAVVYREKAWLVLSVSRITQSTD